jgi:peptidoglycan-N-acetylglucosamine deacetylase
MSTFVIVRWIYLAILLLLIVADFFFLEVHWLFYLIPTVVFVSLLAIGSAHMRLNFFIKVQSGLNTDQKVIALTFDDGPCVSYTPAVLELLEAYGARATFFCIGRKIEKNQALIKTMIDKGHVVGNHSYSHSNFFSFFEKKEVMNEIKKTNALIHKLSGKECAIFRPPYGVTNPHIAKAVKSCGMKVIGWNIRSFDTTTKDYTKVIKRVLPQIKPGAVILLHDDRQNTPKILEEILRYTQQHNYQYALVDELQN